MAALGEPPTIGKIKLIIKQLVFALDYFHSKMIFHRDLKPQNILIDANSNVKIADFGLARRFSPVSKPYSNIVQTLWYRAPEVLLGKTNYGKEIDIWSLGCIFAELLTGKNLFEGRDSVE